MSATLAPEGLKPVRHYGGGTIRIENQVDGIASGYATSLFTGTPIKKDASGNIVACAAGADTPLGVFQGVEYSAAGKRWVTGYWPASQTYDAGTMIAKYTADPMIVYEGQAKGPVAATAVNETINLGDASQGSTNTGFSTQGLNQTTTGGTAGSFKVLGLARYPDNAWGDAFTKLEVLISSYLPAA